MSALLQRNLFERPAPVQRRVLWPHQVRTIDQIRDRVRRGTRKILAVIPTGGGKTICYADVALNAIEKGSHILVIAHRVELINQGVEKLIGSCVPPEHIGVIRANDPRRNPRALIQVASIDTLRNRTRPPADIVMIDEAHRSLSEGYRMISAEYPNAIHIGWTATPWRNDGKGLGRFYEDLIVGATIQELIDGEFLVQPLVYSHPERADLSKVKIRAGDYDEEELALAVDKSPLIGRIVEQWKKHAEGLRTLVFAVSVAHSKHIRDQFCAHGIAAEHLDGTTPAGERTAILHRLHTGKTLVVCNCGVLTEGFDEQLVKCCVLARPTKSRTLLYQCVGRALRVVEGQPEITSAIILDHAGCFHGPDAHPLPETIDESDYTLEDVDKRKRSSVSVRWCEHCFRTAPGGSRVCPHCGVAFEVKSAGGDAEPNILEESDGELVLRQKAEAELTSIRSRIQRAAIAMDRSRGWQDGETNSRLFNRYRKSRTKMNAVELRSVAIYLEGPGFAADNPVPVAPDPTLEPETDLRAGPVETPAWLAKMKPATEPERVEFEL